MALQKLTASTGKINNIKEVYNTRKVNTGTSENPTYKFDVQLPATDADQVYYNYNSTSVGPTGTVISYGTEFGDNSGSILSLKTVIDKIITKIGTKNSVIGALGTFENGDINARIKWLYDNRINTDDIGTFWKYIGQIDSLQDENGNGILGKNDPNHPTQIKKSIRVSEGNPAPLPVDMLASLSIPDTEVITLSNPSGSVKWKELKVGSVIHVENVKPNDTTKIHSEYVLISISTPEKVTVNHLGGGNTYDYYINFIWTEFGPDLSGYAKTSDVNKKISDLNTKVDANTENVTANSTVINNIVNGNTSVRTARSLAENRTLELNINNGTSNIGVSASITLPLGEPPVSGDDSDDPLSVSATLTLPDSGVITESYSCVAVNSKGIVTYGQQFIGYATNLTEISKLPKGGLAVGGLAIVESLE